MEKVSKTLSGHLSRIQESIARMDECTDAIPLIERDVLLAELRDMYTAVCLLGTVAPVAPKREAETAVSENSDVRNDSLVTPSEQALAAAPAATMAAVATAQGHEDGVAPEAAETAAPEMTATAEEEEAPTPETDATAAQEEETPVAEAENTATQEELPLTPQEPEQPVEAPEEEASPLLIDEDTQPVYAEETEADEPTTPTEGVPTMEEIEGNRNDTLFDEQEAVATPVQPRQEQPQTLWDKLQEGATGATGATVGESIAAGKTLSDLYLERKQQSATEQQQTAAAPHMETSQAAAAPAPEPEPGPEQEPIPEPAPQPAPAAEAPVPQRNNRQEAPQHQSSLFDYLKQPEPKPRTEAPTVSATHTIQSAPTIADTMGHQMGNTTEHKLNSSHVSDLRTIININDKFSFMNELFHNNMKGYNDFILRLNSIANRDEAMNYVQQVARQYNWDNESMTVKTFFTIFDRKF